MSPAGYDALLVAPVALLFPALLGLLLRSPGGSERARAMAAGAVAGALAIAAQLALLRLDAPLSCNFGLVAVAVACAVYGLPAAALGAAVALPGLLGLGHADAAAPVIGLAAAGVAGCWLHRASTTARREAQPIEFAGLGVAVSLVSEIVSLTTDAAPRPSLSIALPVAVSGALSLFAGGLVRDQLRLGRTRRDLAQAVGRLTDFVETAADWLWESDRDHVIKGLHGVARTSSFDPRTLLGHGWLDIARGADDTEAIQRLGAGLDARATFRDVPLMLLDRDGTRQTIQISGKPIVDEAGRFAGYRGSARDMSGRLRARERLSSAIAQAEVNQRRYHALAENCPFGILQMSRDGDVQYMNIAMRLLLEVDDAAELKGKSVRERFVFEGFDPFEQDPQSPYAALRGGQEGALTGLRSGIRRHVIVTCVPIPAGDGQAESRLATVVDVTERRRNEEIIRYMAQHDGLTGLPNRGTFLDRIHQAVVNARRIGRMVGVLYLDLDHFKDINDTLGHAVGDRLLCAVANRLTQRLRESDTVARLGGDEFGILATNLSAAEDGTLLSDKIAEALADGFRIDDHEILVTTSLGITVYPIDDSTPEQLLRDAEIALYRAKSDGRNTCQFYNELMKAEIDARKTLERDLRKALESEQFTLHYQPQVDLISGQVTGVEALIRWECPKRGLVSPRDFIPLAETTGLLVPIGEWALTAALRQAQAWREEGLEVFPVAVNVSAIQFKRADMRRVIAEQLERWRLPPSCLEIEVTESAIMDDLAEMTARLTDIRDLGVTISIDDFGTGHSSLANLRRFPVHKLKIDRSFVMGIAEDREDAAIIEAIVRLGRSLGITVIAEGVETQAQLGILRRIRCDQGQGFHFTRPLPADDFARWCREESGLRSVGGAG